MRPLAPVLPFTRGPHRPPSRLAYVPPAPEPAPVVLAPPALRPEDYYLVRIFDRQERCPDCRGVAWGRRTAGRFFCLACGQAVEIRASTPEEIA